jgi:NAD(P)H-dependent FMN reductase
MALKLNIVICSTRPTRVGPSVAKWFAEYAKTHSQFDIELVDLVDMNLPLFDEPKHPAMRDYQHDHTKRWSASVDSADAFIFVTPEYNYCAPPSFYNALNYLVKEWNYKPCGFVGYGGVSGGIRAIQQAKTLVTTLKMMPMTECVMAPMVATLIDENKQFKSNELIDKSADALLAELHKWAQALKPMRG